MAASLALLSLGGSRSRDTGPRRDTVPTANRDVKLSVIVPGANRSGQRVLHPRPEAALYGTEVSIVVVQPRRDEVRDGLLHGVLAFDVGDLFPYGPHPGRFVSHGQGLRMRQP